MVLVDGTALWGGRVNALTLQNWPIQATGGSILRAAVARLADYEARPYLAFTLHDAIYFWCYPKFLEEKTAIVREAMVKGWRSVLAGDEGKTPKVGDPEIDATVYGVAPGLVERCKKEGYALKRRL